MTEEKTGFQEYLRTHTALSVIVAFLIAALAALGVHDVVGDESHPTTTTTIEIPTTTTQSTTTTTLDPSATYASTSAEFHAKIAKADHIILLPGTYSGINELIKHKVTIEGQGNVILDGVGVKSWAFKFGTGSDGSVLRGVTIQNYEGTATSTTDNSEVVINANNVTIANNTITKAKASGISVFGHNATIRNNLITANGKSGIHGHLCDGLIVDGNTISNNRADKSYAASGKLGDTAGLKVTKTKTARITNNIVTGNDSTGIWGDSQDADFWIENNHVERNTIHGIFYEVSTRGQILNNTIVANGGFSIKISSNNVTIVNNTIPGLLNKIFVYEDARTVANDPKCAAGASYGADCSTHDVYVDGVLAEVKK